MLLVGAALAPKASAQDLALTQVHTITVSDRNSALSVTEDVSVSRRYLSARSTDIDNFGVSEQYFNLVSDFSAKLDGRGVNRRRFESSMIESRDAFLSGGTSHRFSLEATPAVGSTIAYTYKRAYESAAYLPVYTVPNFGLVERYVVEVKHDPSVEVTFGVAFPRDDVPYRLEEVPGRTSIVFENLSEAESMPLFDYNDHHASVQIRLKRGGNVLTPTSPDEFAAWYGGFIARGDTSITPALRELAATLQRDTPEATVSAIHDHVRQSIRYILDARGEGAFLPRAPDLVNTRAYGDCKDRAFLVATLARALGLRVDIVLIGTEPEPASEGVSLFLYNHVINAFEQDGRRVFFDPTHPYLAYGDLPDSDVDGRALRIGADAVEDLRIAAQDSLPSLDVLLQMNLDQANQATATIVVRGDLLGSVRGTMARGHGTDVQNLVSAIAGNTLVRTRLSSLELIEDEPYAVTFRGRADLSDFVVSSPTRRYLPLTPFLAVSADAMQRKQDTFSLTTDGRPNVRMRLTVEPGAWSAEPAEVHWGGDHASFSSSVEADDAGTHVSYEFRQRTRRFSGPERDAYLSFAEQYLGARRDMITFNRVSE